MPENLGEKILFGREGHFTTPFHFLVLSNGKTARGLFDYLRSEGIYAPGAYIPAHTLSYYKAKGWNKGDFPIAEAYYDHCLSLPMFPSLSDEEQECVIEKVLKFTEA